MSALIVQYLRALAKMPLSAAAPANADIRKSHVNDIVAEILRIGNHNI